MVKLTSSVSRQKGKGMKLAKILAFIAVAAIGTGIVMNMRDIKRYIRIRNM
jgi:hypothetical protein